MCVQVNKTPQALWFLFFPSSLLQIKYAKIDHLGFLVFGVKDPIILCVFVCISIRNRSIGTRNRFKRKKLQTNQIHHLHAKEEKETNA